MLKMIVLASIGVEFGIMAVSIVVGSCQLVGIKEVDERAWCGIQMIEFLCLDYIFLLKLLALLVLVSLGA